MTFPNSEHKCINGLEWVKTNEKLLFFTLYCIFHNLYRMLHSKRVYFHSKGLNLHCQWMKLRRKCVNYSFSIVFWKHYNARKKIPRPPDVTVATFLVGASAGSLTINNYLKSQFVQINLHRPQSNFAWSYTFWIDLKFCAALSNQDRARFLERPATTLSLNLAWLRRSLECASYPFQPKITETNLMHVWMCKYYEGIWVCVIVYLFIEVL